MEELCVSLAASPVVCVKFNSLRQLHNKTTKTLRNFHAEFWTRIIFFILPGITDSKKQVDVQFLEIFNEAEVSVLERNSPNAHQQNKYCFLLTCEGKIPTPFLVLIRG